MNGINEFVTPSTFVFNTLLISNVPVIKASPYTFSEFVERSLKLAKPDASNPLLSIPIFFTFKVILILNL